METETTGRTELPPPGGLMTVREAGAELGVSHMTVHRMIQAGVFRVYQPTERRLWVLAGRDEAQAQERKGCFVGVEGRGPPPGRVTWTEEHTRRRDVE
jgi:excisionase family DNA binding protein